MYYPHHNDKLFKSRDRKAATHHNASSSVLHSWDTIFILVYSIAVYMEQIKSQIHQSTKPSPLVL